MARPRKQPAGGDLSPGQAAYVLERLMRERRVSRGEVNQYVSDMGQEINDLELKLQRLREAHGGIVKAAVHKAADTVAAATAVVRRRRRRKPGRPAKRGRRPAASAAAAKPAAAAPKTRRRRRASITAEQVASRKLQGRYLSLVRQFPANKRAQFAKTAKDRGREAAIKEMTDLLKK